MSHVGYDRALALQEAGSSCSSSKFLSLSLLICLAFLADGLVL